MGLVVPEASVRSMVLLVVVVCILDALYDAEIFAALRGLQAAHDCWQSHIAPTIDDRRAHGQPSSSSTPAGMHFLRTEFLDPLKKAEATFVSP